MRRPRFLIELCGAAQATRAALEAQSYALWAYVPAPEQGYYAYEYVLRLKPGTLLHPNALEYFARAVERAQFDAPDMLYADEGAFDGEKITGEIKKDSFNRITALAYDIFGAALAIRADIYYACQPPPPDAEGAAEYGFKLRCMAKSRSVVHIPHTLLYQRFPRAAVNAAQGLQAVKHYAAQSGRAETVRAGLWPGSYIVQAQKQPRLISIIIPNINAPDALRRLLESIERCCPADKFEIIIADGGSTDGRLLKYYSLLQSGRAARIVRHNAGGFAALCRAGAENADGDALLFVSRDAEFIEPNTLSALAAQGERDGVSAAGCTLIDPQGAIIFAGGQLSPGGDIAYPYCGAAPAAAECSMAATLRAVDTLSGALMYMRADMYFSSGGFDISFDAPEYEPLQPLGADAEICIRQARRGLSAVYTPAACAVLHRPPARLAAAPERVRIRCRDALRPAKGQNCQ